MRKKQSILVVGLLLMTLFRDTYLCHTEDK